MRAHDSVPATTGEETVKRVPRRRHGLLLIADGNYDRGEVISL